MRRRSTFARMLVVLVQSVLIAAGILLLAESLGWHVLSEAGGVTASVVR